MKYYVIDQIDPSVQKEFNTEEELLEYLNGPDWFDADVARYAKVIYGSEVKVVSGKVSLEPHK